MRYVALLATLLITAFSAAQPLGSDWSYTAPETGQFVGGGFLPDGKVIVRERGLGFNSDQVICFDPASGPVWTVDVTAEIRDMLITTDGFVYITAKPHNSKPFIYALNSATGAIAWQHTVNPSYADLSEMRIFGGNLLVGGFTSDPMLMSFTRTSGAVNFTRTYPASTETGITSLRANTQFLFANLNRGISKIDPATGNILATRESVAFNDFQVDSANNVYVGSAHANSSALNWLRRYNFSGNGPVADPVYEALNQGVSSMLLSGGFVYGTSENRLVKYKPSDGSVVWTREEPPSYRNSFSVFKADGFGRLHVLTNLQEVSEYSSGRWESTGNWTYRILDAATGLDLSSLQIASTDHTKDGEAIGNALYLNGFGEALLLGTKAIYSRESAWGPLHKTLGLATIAYQTPVPQPDLYTCAENEIFASSGNGVLKNDRYVNPAATTAILISPPSAGNLTMLSNGEFVYDATGVAPGDYTFIYEATRGELSGTVTSTIRVSRGLLRLALTRVTLAGQNATQGTVTMSSPGAASAVSISDDSSLVTTPSTVTVPAGQTAATFGIQVLPVTSQIVTHVRATNGGFTRTAELTLVPLIPTALAFSPSSTVVGGNPVSCRVVMNGVAGAGGRVVAIYDNNVYSIVPSQVTVPPGASQVTFQVQTTHPTSLQISKITAAVTAGIASANLRITP